MEWVTLSSLKKHRCILMLNPDRKQDFGSSQDGKARLKCLFVGWNLQKSASCGVIQNKVNTWRQNQRKKKCFLTVRAALFLQRTARWRAVMPSLVLKSRWAPPLRRTLISSQLSSSCTARVRGHSEAHGNKSLLGWRRISIFKVSNSSTAVRANWTMALAEDQTLLREIKSGKTV